MRRPVQSRHEGNEGSEVSKARAVTRGQAGGSGGHEARGRAASSAGTSAGTSADELLAPALLDIVRQIPNARVGRSAHPRAEARRLARHAASKAALTAGALALPAGPLGWLTLLPELRSVWRIQAQLVADIAALHGRKGLLTKEHLLYCLFSHGSARQAFNDLVVRVGGRFVVRPATAKALAFVARQVAVRVAQRLAGQGAARWLPVAGAVGIGAYAWHETSRVADAAIELFEMELLPAPDAEDATPAGPAAVQHTGPPRLPR